jgi:hypothetical protein
MILLWLAACAYRVNLTSLPMPARVTLPDGSVVVTPVEVQARWVPFGAHQITVDAPGYRPLTVDLRRSGGPNGEVRLVLVPDHGPAGTWSTEDENLR